MEPDWDHKEAREEISLLPVSYQCRIYIYIYAHICIYVRVYIYIYT